MSLENTPVFNNTHPSYINAAYNVPQSQPHYEYELRHWLYEVLELIAKHKVIVVDGRKKIKKREEEIAENKQRLNEAGLFGTGHWAHIDREVEGVAMDKSKLNNIEKELGFNIEDGVVRTLGFWNEVNRDFNCRKMTEGEYKKYLQKFGSVLDAGSTLEMSCFKTVTANKIAAEIEKYLQTEN